MLSYNSNPKHREPWQPGRKGALCPKWTWPLADEILQSSEPSQTGKKCRYATYDGWAFEAQPDNLGGWHGYPVPWVEVEEPIRRRWIDEGKVRKRLVNRRMTFDDVTLHELEVGR